MSGRILVINPNSNERVTADIAGAVEGLRIAGGPAIDCVTLAEGPPGIETQVHVDTVVEPLLRLAKRESNRASSMVIACFSDPGLYSLREALDIPVYGIAERGFAVPAVYVTSLKDEAAIQPLRGLIQPGGAPQRRQDAGGVP